MPAAAIHQDTRVILAASTAHGTSSKNSTATRVVRGAGDFIAQRFKQFRRGQAILFVDRDYAVQAPNVENAPGQPVHV